MVRVTGLEPAHLSVQEPKSCVSANSTTSAYLKGRDVRLTHYLTGVSYASSLLVVTNSLAIFKH